MYQAGRIYSSLGTGTNLVQGWYLPQVPSSYQAGAGREEEEEEEEGLFLLPQKKYQPGRLLSNT